MGSVERANAMKLSDVVDQIDKFDEGLTVYVAPEWTPDSTVLVAREPDGGGVPPEAQTEGMRYFLEIFVMKEVLEGLKDLDLDGRTRRLIRYAITDA